MTGRRASVHENGHITVDGIPVEVIRKRIKHLRLAVYPPDGRVRISVPLHVDEATTRAMVATKIGWIERQRGRLHAQERPAPLHLATGERHLVDGLPLRLEVIEQQGAPRVEINGQMLELRVKPGSDVSRRLSVLESWHRERLRDRVHDLIATWEPRLGVSVSDVGIRRMRTRWGSCNVRAGRIWLNLELAKRSPGCVEYVVVHEMVHLLERRHDARFYGLMDGFLPGWRLRRDELNRAAPEQGGSDC